MPDCVWLEPYWRQFIDIKIAAEYYYLYIHNAKRWMATINVFCFLTSCAAVVSWATAYLTPFVSSLIVLVSQIVSVLQPFYPFSDRYYASRCIHREIKKYALKAEQTLNRALYGSMDEDALPAALEELQNSVSAIEETYAPADLFPRKNRLHEKAEENALTYLRIHFNYGGQNEQQNDSETEVTQRQ